MQISPSSPFFIDPRPSIHIASHPLFIALQQGDEKALLSLDPHTLNRSISHPNELIQALPNLMECMSRLSPSGAYQAALLLRHMLYNLYISKPRDFNFDHTHLSSALRSIDTFIQKRQETSIQFELSVLEYLLAGMMKSVEIADCFENICKFSYRKNFLKECTVDEVAKQVRETARILRAIPQSSEFLGAGFQLREDIQQWQKEYDQVQKEEKTWKEKVSQEMNPDNVKHWAQEAIKLHFCQMRQDALQACANSPERSWRVIRDQLKLPEQIEAALNQMSQKIYSAENAMEIDKTLKEELPNLCCRLTGEPMKDPVIAGDGHTYDRTAIEDHFKRSTLSPVTGKEMGKTLIPNLALKTLIEDLRKKEQVYFSRKRKAPEDSQGKAAVIEATVIDLENVPPSVLSPIGKMSVPPGIMRPVSSGSFGPPFGPIPINPPPAAKPFAPIPAGAKIAPPAWPPIQVYSPAVKPSAPIPAGAKIAPPAWPPIQVYSPAAKLSAPIPAGAKIAPPAWPSISGESVNHSSLRPQQLIEQIHRNPAYPELYLELAKLTRANETIQLLNRQSMTRRELLLKVIELDPRNAKAYHLLAGTLAKKETIRLGNGELKTKQELLFIAVDLDFDDPEALHDLIMETPTSQDPLTLLNGDVRSRAAFLTRVGRIRKKNRFAS